MHGNIAVSCCGAMQYLVIYSDPEQQLWLVA